MATVLRHDGANDYLTISNTVNFVAGDTLEFKFRILTNQTFAWISNGPTSVSAYVRWNGSTLRARGTQTGPAVSPPAGINLADGEFHTVQLILSATTHKFNVDGTDTANLTGNVSTSMFNTLSAFFNSYFDGDLEYIKISNSGGTKFNWDANSSSTGPGATTLTETIAGNDATGVGFPTDGSQWIDTGGGGINATITESYDNFTESITAQIDTNVSVAITESYSDFTESISALVEADINVEAAITESYADFTESIGVTVTEAGNITASITESYDAFTESVSVDVSANITAEITESYSDFTESISVNFTQEVDAVITESYADFSESITVQLPVRTTINPRNTIQVNRRTNRVTIGRKTNIIKVR